MLHTLYLSMHGLGWVNLKEKDRADPLWEQWPGRCDLVYPLAFEYRLRIRQLIEQAPAEAGLLIVPGDLGETQRIVAYAKPHFGQRCVVSDGEDLGPDFTGSQAEDRRRAAAHRPASMSDRQFNARLNSWASSKGWAVDLRAKLRARGYTFDPATVRVVCFGSDWRGCAASFPIQMGRAWGLAYPIERRWGLIMHDWGPLDVTATLIVGNIPLPHHIRLFVFKTASGRYCAEYWEGLHGPSDRPHVVSLQFPDQSVRVVDLFGRSVNPGHRTFGARTAAGRTIVPPRAGDRDKRYGRLAVNVGAGHASLAFPDIIAAGPDLSLDAFYAALVAGRVSAVE